MDSIIMKETDKQSKISNVKAFGFILGVIFVINLVVMLINRLEPGIAGIASIALILGMMCLTYRVVDRKVVEYNYILKNKEIIFQKVTGRREKTVLEISFEDILYIEPEDNREKPANIHYLLCNRKGPGRFIMGFTYKDKFCGVIFHPGSKMVEGIQKRMG